MSRNVLTMKEALYLAQLIKDYYVDSKLDNVAFANYINKTEDHNKQFRSPVTQSHVKNMLISLEIESNRAWSKTKK